MTCGQDAEVCHSENAREVGASSGSGTHVATTGGNTKVVRARGRSSANVTATERSTGQVGSGTWRGTKVAMTEAGREVGANARLSTKVEKARGSARVVGGNTRRSTPNARSASEVDGTRRRSAPVARAHWSIAGNASARNVGCGGGRRVLVVVGGDQA